MDDKARRNLGAHYTSETNILKLIKPLFLDELHAEFDRIKGNRNKLFEFHKKLRQLTFFDPACGCGNFLVISYRELRELELKVLRASHNLSAHPRVFWRAFIAKSTALGALAQLVSNSLRVGREFAVRGYCLGYVPPQ